MAYTLRYSGPKLLCSASGVGFNKCKEDKYIYLIALCELIYSVDHDYRSGENRVIQTGQRSYDERSILDLIQAHSPDFDKTMEELVAKTEQEITKTLIRARENRLLSQEEKNTLINNIEITRPYQIQRTINKGVYYIGINALASIIQKRYIGNITTAMEPKYLTVLHSLQTALRRLHPSIDSNISIFEKQEHLVVELKILV